MRGPSGLIENAMVGLKVRLLSFAHDAQNGGHGSVAMGQDGAGEEDLGVLPNGP